MKNRKSLAKHKSFFFRRIGFEIEDYFLQENRFELKPY